MLLELFISPNSKEQSIPLNQRSQPDLEVLITTLLHHIEAKEIEIHELRNQLQQGNEGVGEGEQPPPQPPAHAAILLAAQAVPHVIPLIGQVNAASDLFERFKRRRDPKFEGSTDSLVAYE